VLKIPSLRIAEATAEALQPWKIPPSCLQVWRDADGVDRAHCFVLQGRHWIHVPGVANFSFSIPADVVTAIPRFAIPTAQVHETYRRSVLPLVLQAAGTEILHASGVRASEGVVAFCGVSGVGKSTIALALSRRGVPLWADDALAVDTAGSSICSTPLPFEMRLRPQAAAFFGSPSPHGSGAERTASSNAEDKEGVPLVAVCVLERLGTGSCGVEVERLRPSAALPRLLAHAYCFSLKESGSKRRMIQHYVDLSARQPVIEVRFQPALERLPAILDAIERAVIAIPSH
jgi:hypothetical protein